LVSPFGRVVAFEPNAKSRIILEKNLLLNRYRQLVEIEPLALFDKTGSHSFFTRGIDAMSSLVRSGFGSNSNAADISEETVRTITLDDYLDARKLTSPKWIKIDCEGAEVNVLKGANQALRSDTNIICELHPYAWNEFGTTLEDLLSLVRTKKKQIRYLDESMDIHNGAAYGVVIITN
jgi:FkbM family methyltransferase